METSQALAVQDIANILALIVFDIWNFPWIALLYILETLGMSPGFTTTMIVMSAYSAFGIYLITIGYEDFGILAIMTALWTMLLEVSVNSSLSLGFMQIPTCVTALEEAIQDLLLLQHTQKTYTSSLVEEATAVF